MQAMIQKAKWIVVSRLDEDLRTCSQRIVQRNAMTLEQVG